MLGSSGIVVELKIQIQCSSHELTFASKNCTIQKISTMINDVTANELFSSFELWISRDGNSLIKVGRYGCVGPTLTEFLLIEKCLLSMIEKCCHATKFLCKICWKNVLEQSEFLPQYLKFLPLGILKF